AVAGVGLGPVALEQAAVKQDLEAVDLQEVHRPGNGAGGPPEGDARFGVVRAHAADSIHCGDWWRQAADAGNGLVVRESYAPCCLPLSNSSTPRFSARASCLRRP